MRALPIGAAAALTSVVAVGLGACSSTSAPVAGTYTVTFQSTQEAVATDTIQMMAFDVTSTDGGATGACLDLISRRQSNQDLPVPVAQDQPIAVCSPGCAGGTCTGGSVNVPLGTTIAFLVVGQKAQKDLLRGCVVAKVGADQTNVQVPLFLVPQTQVAPTTCQKLSDHCANQCQ